MLENLYWGVGIDEIEVLYEGSERCMLFLVVNYKFPPTLLGKKVKLDCRARFLLSVKEVTLKLLPTDFNSMFDDELSCLKNLKMKFPVEEKP